MSIVVVLRPGQSGNDVYLRPDRSAIIDVYLYSGQTGNDVYLRPARRPYDVAAGPPPPSFPTQFSGARFGAAGNDLSLVATADAPVGVGGQLRWRGTSATLALYLVATTDPNASPLRIRTTTGTMSVRRKT